MITPTPGLDPDLVPGIALAAVPIARMVVVAGIGAIIAVAIVLWWKGRPH